MTNNLINLTLLEAGYCTHPEWVILQGGGRQHLRLPALFALLKHPHQGTILIDTGYSPHLFDCVKHFPYNLYPKLIPPIINNQTTAAAQLNALGISPDSIQTIIISHFHPDHIGGLRDFPHAKFIYFQAAYQAVRDLRGFKALQAAFFAGLLPSNFQARSQPFNLSHFNALPPHYAPFENGVDLFNDATVIAVPLPGHAHGQLGFFMQTQQWGTIFLAADACWHSRAYQQLIFPHPIATVTMADRHAYRQTLTKLHHLHQQQPNMPIIPFHCPNAGAKYVQPPPQLS